MAVGTTTSVKHNLKEDLGEGVPRGSPDEHQEGKTDEREVLGSGDSKQKSGTHQSHECCRTCGSLADKCSCKDCECQMCSSNTGSKKASAIEPPIKLAASSVVVCGGGCIAAAQRATGGCPGCECPAGACPCTKCGCPICGPHQKAMKSTPCYGGSEAGARATAGNCPACGCPAGNCPCTECKCPVCNSK